MDLPFKLWKPHNKRDFLFSSIYNQKWVWKIFIYIYIYFIFYIYAFFKKILFSILSIKDYHIPSFYVFIANPMRVSIYSLALPSLSVWRLCRFPALHRIFFNKDFLQALEMLSTNYNNFKTSHFSTCWSLVPISLSNFLVGLTFLNTNRNNFFQRTYVTKIIHNKILN